MKKNLLLTTLLLATTLTFTACGKVDETPLEESTVAMEETVVEEESSVEEETETVEEFTTEETLSMTEDEIRAFLEEVRDMDYESYTMRHARYYTNRTDADGNPMDDHVYEDFYFSVDADDNLLVEGLHLTNEDSELTDDTHTTHYIFADGTYASNLVATQENFDWDALKEDIVYGQYLNYAKFFDLYSVTDEDIDILIAKATVTEYNGRPALYYDNLLDSTEKDFLEYLYSDADTLTPTEGSFVFDIYLYLDVPGEYISLESVEMTDSEGTTTVHDVYELSKVNSTELPEIPENFIKY